MSGSSPLEMSKRGSSPLVAHAICSLYKSKYKKCLNLHCYILLVKSASDEQERVKSASSACKRARLSTRTTRARSQSPDRAEPDRLLYTPHPASAPTDRRKTAYTTQLTERSETACATQRAYKRSAERSETACATQRAHSAQRTYTSAPPSGARPLALRNVPKSAPPSGARPLALRNVPTPKRLPSGARPLALHSVRTPKRPTERSQTASIAQRAHQS